MWRRQGRAAGTRATQLNSYGRGVAIGDHPGPCAVPEMVAPSRVAQHGQHHCGARVVVTQAGSSGNRFHTPSH
jgi:hypothetical protein